MTIQEMRDKRAELGYSYEQLSELTKLPYSTIQKVFSGTTRAPRRATIVAIERVLSADTHTGETLICSGAADGNVHDTGIAYAPFRGMKKQLYEEGIANESAPFYETERKKHKYSVDDYFRFSDQWKRCELIDGTVYDMASPNVRHQWICAQLVISLSLYIEENGGRCRAFTAPLDVVPDPDDRYTVVQPDVMVICDPGKYEKGYCIGPPDLIVEVLSPSTRRKDLFIKAGKYAQADVREYWIVDPDAERVIVYDFENDEVPAIYGFDSDVPVSIWGGKCKVNFRNILKKLVQDP